MAFTKFGLSDHIVQGIGKAGYTTPTPIQSLAIRPALAGKDIIGCAQTGTGKTAAFVWPILHRLAESGDTKSRGRHPRALVLTPTRELAQQVQNAAATYGRFLTLKAVSIYGGASMDNQLKLLRRGADIIVATPGRLLDHMERGTIQLSKIEVLVLDEADRMLDMGFINEVRKILAKVPRERQTLLFSATLSSEINDLADRALRDPQMVEVGERRNPVETITQYFYTAPKESKIDILLHALEAGRMESVLVFSRTKHGADKISRRLERKGITSVAIHSNRTQSQRERALEGFKRGKHRVMVATDIAARGIDVTGISHVINFDIPHYAEDYIHRIGRTGRAGATGDAITLVGPDEMVYLKRIEQFTGKRFRVNPYPGVVARASAPAPRKESSSGRQPRKSTSGTHKQFSRKKKQNIISARKKKRPLKKLEAFSSDAGSKAWSNY